MLGFDRITFNPRIMAGQACIRGMRIPVSLIVNLVANGKPTEEILEEYPDLEPEDIKQSFKLDALVCTFDISTPCANYSGDIDPPSLICYT